MMRRLLGKTVPLWGGMMLLLFVALASGCGGGKGSVSGRVTWNGKPLPVGTISFHSEEGHREVFNALIRNGSYTLDGIPAGAARITVVIGPLSGGKPPQGGADVQPRTEDEDPENPTRLPLRYADPGQSGLSLDVKAGSQSYDVPLKP